MVTPNITELVFELVNCDLTESIVLVGGATPPAVPFRRYQPELRSLLGSAAGIHELKHILELSKPPLGA